MWNQILFSTPKSLIFFCGSIAFMKWRKKGRKVNKWKDLKVLTIIVYFALLNGFWCYCDEVLWFCNEYCDEKCLRGDDDDGMLCVHKKN